MPNSRKGVHDCLKGVSDSLKGVPDSLKGVLDSLDTRDVWQKHGRIMRGKELSLSGVKCSGRQ